jgi:hypothetical protein
MKKVAEQVKFAEVSGVVAAGADNGILKIASEQEFRAVVDVVRQNVGDDYTVKSILQVAGQALGDVGLKKEAVFGTAMGAIRAARLSDEDRQLLEKEYGLQPGAGLGKRNAARGWLGEAAGVVPGTALALYGLSKGRFGLAGAGAALGSAGGIAGSYLGTNKYSKGRAQQLRDAKALLAKREGA